MPATFVLINLALGGVALILLLPLRPDNGGLPKLALGMCLGVIAGVAAINVTTSISGTSRDSVIRPGVKYALEQADASKPQLLIIGSRYTSLGVDNGAVERELNKKGYPVQVLELANPGDFAMSQDHTIDYYIARAEKVPEYIFIELGPEYYNDPGDMYPSYLNTATAIDDHGPDQLWWRARSLTVYPASPSEKLAKFWNLFTHFLFHMFDFGLSGQLLTDSAVAASPGFRPQYKVYKPVLTTDIAPIASPAMPLSLAPIPPHVQFLLEFRRMQVKRLIARGAKVVGFFQPALTPVGIRVYGVQVCRELRNVPCITAEDPKIRKELDNPALWFDPVHLLHSGAEKYSVWLADRIALSLRPSGHAR